MKSAKFIVRSFSSTSFLIIFIRVILDKASNMLENFSKERDWKKYHTPKDLAILISIESGELLESFQWLKDEEITQVLNDPKKFQRTIHTTLPNESENSSNGILSEPEYSSCSNAI